MRGSCRLPATFYVDGETGSDAAAGTAESAAWKSLEKVNAAELIPGDRVLFKRGGLWRGQLIPRSGSNGAPVVYGAYGAGDKPILQGSVARNRPEEWTEAAPGIWVARRAEPQLLGPLADLTGSSWAIHSEAGAKVRLTQEQEDGRAPDCQTTTKRGHPQSDGTSVLICPAAGPCP